MNNYNPDVLSCLANLSNDEVFTPPQLANQMLDMLPQELFRSPDTKFLDPCTKSGVFLREIAKRLIDGLADVIPDLQARIDHIMHHQLYGIAITRLTSMLSRRSLYCSKDASGKYSLSHFDDADGNIRFRDIKHTWLQGKCQYCGASQEVYDRGDDLESHAYEFIHTDKPNTLYNNMTFDVIIGNPPYQLSDGGEGGSATPIYQLFVEQAKKLKPKYLTMIIPARWYGGGRGLDEFRKTMIEDKRIRCLHDFLDASACFGNGVEIKGGVCYFLWDRDNKGECQVFTHRGDVIETSNRYLQEKNSNVFIRYRIGVNIYHKVRKKNEKTIDGLVSSQRPFGLRTFVHGEQKYFDNAITLYENGGIGYMARKNIPINQEWIDRPKVYVSRAYNAGDSYPHQIIGKPIVGKAGSCCTETYIVIGPFSSLDEAYNVASYIKTRFFRFLVMLKKTSQQAAAPVYQFVPLQDFSKPWTDEELYKKYGLTDEEIAFIESMIRPME
jgi:site-specific DNA-methyltransferase (adenine-specific)